MQTLALPGNWSAPAAKTYTHDANGSIVNDAISQFAYDARGRLNQATTAQGTFQYQVSALGQRVRKTAATADAAYHFDSAGHLVAETDALGNVQQEYIYLGDTLAAVMR